MSRILSEEIADLNTMLTMLSEYSANMNRLGLHDLVLLETLRDKSEQLTVTPEEALARIIETGDAVFIGGPKAYIWEEYDEDVLDKVKQLDLLKPYSDDDEVP